MVDPHTEGTLPLPPPGPGSRSRPDQRWRVVVVRIPPEARAEVRAVLPGGRSIGRNELPLVVRTTGDRQRAHHTALRLRAAGAVVLVMEEPTEGEGAFCTDHPARIAARTCLGCGRPVCTNCSLEARGEDVCGVCRVRGRSPRARVRRRQLFVLFLFAVFLYEVADWWEHDRDAVDPSKRVRVAVFQFVPPEQPFAPIVRDLNRLPEGQEADASLYGLARWFGRERARYGGQAGYLDVDVFGPWGRVVSPPDLEDPDLGPWQAGWRAWQYARYFHDLAADQGEDPDDYAARVYVVYSREAADLASHSRGSEQGRVAVVYVDLDETNPGYAALTVAHELAHTLGAKDLYDPATSLARHPEGFVEPFADPLYPQRFAELMAADIPVGPRSEREVRSLDEVRVGYATARDMGWIDPGLAEVFYTPAQTSPAERLDPLHTPALADEPPPVAPVAED